MNESSHTDDTSDSSEVPREVDQSQRQPAGPGTEHKRPPNDARSEDSKRPADSSADDKLTAAVVAARSAATTARWTGIVSGITVVGSLIALIFATRYDPLQHRLDYIEAHEKLYSETLVSARTTLLSRGEPESRFAFMQLYSVVQSARDDNQRIDEKHQLVQLVGLTHNGEVKRVFIGLRRSDGELDTIAATPEGVYALAALANETPPPASSPTPEPPSPGPTTIPSPNPSGHPSPKPSAHATARPSTPRPSPGGTFAALGFAADLSDEPTSERGLLQSAVGPKQSGWVYLGIGKPDHAGALNTLTKSRALASDAMPKAGETVVFCREVHVRDGAPNSAGLGQVIGATRIGATAKVTGAPIEVPYRTGKVVWAPVSFVAPSATAPQAPCL